MEEQVKHVFVSYSHEDEAIVTPIVKLIRSIGAPTFLDSDSIEFGKRWRPVIESSIDNATLVLVFWCSHAQASSEVEREWKQAVQGGKTLVPIIIDHTPLDAEISEFHGVDLRPLFPNHGLPGMAMLEGDHMVMAAAQKVLASLEELVDRENAD